MATPFYYSGIGRNVWSKGIVITLCSCPKYLCIYRLHLFLNLGCILDIQFFVPFHHHENILILMSSCTNSALLHFYQCYAWGRFIDKVNFSDYSSSFVSGSFTSFCCLRYERFIVALEEASRDMLPALKNKSLKVSFPYTIYFVLFLVSNSGLVFSLTIDSIL